MNSPSNQRRVFEHAVAIDAWDSPLDNGKAANVHVDVSFMVARLGQEEDCPVRFKLSIGRAELIFSIPEFEPLKVIQHSVAREQQPFGRVVRSRRSVQGASGSLEGAIKAGVNPLHFRARGSAERSTNDTTEITTEQPYSQIKWIQSASGGGEYRWAFESSSGPSLAGKPWDPVEHPILAIVFTGNKSSGLAPAGRLRLVCKKEDLKISDLESKTSNFFSIEDFGSLKNRTAAAEALIRRLLADRGLGILDFSDKYGDVELAELMVEKGIDL
jgi:hypothetical protein